ncbi:hypothetical protein BN1013_00853 [Candidatus Rubidus massiliensis]|nr:hypothetical protein BN1013_00853 [Candidatus Rubidus massiliensis]
MRNLFLLIQFCLFIGITLEAKPIKVRQASFVDNTKPVIFKINHAISPNEKKIGLMGVKFMPYNQGLLFHQIFQNQSIWMYNCFINLSIGFFDKKGLFIQSSELQAHPELLKEEYFTSEVDYTNPTVQFFIKNSATTPLKTYFVLEMNQNWFKDQQIARGDILFWDGNDAVITTPIDVSKLKPHKIPYLISLANDKPVALYNESGKNDFIFLDNECKVIQVKNNSSIYCFCQRNTQYILIAPVGWKERYNCKLNQKLELVIKL